MIYDLENNEEVKDNQIDSNKRYMFLYNLSDSNQLYSYFDCNIIDEIIKNRGVRYEEYRDFDVICLWKRRHLKDIEDELIYVFIKQNQIFFIGDVDYLSKLIEKIILFNKNKQSDIGNVLFLFLLNITKEYQSVLNDFENDISILEDKVLDGKDDHIHPKEILHYRKQLLLKKRRYESIQDILDYISENNNDFYDDCVLKKFELLKKRFERMLSHVDALLEYVTEVREAYQSSMDIKQNNIMQLFTIISAIFLPLTLIVGWYGMNFHMPEFESELSYPIVIVVCILIVVFCIRLFKKKKWF